MRSYQFYKKKEVIHKSSNIRKGKILDVGCGTGDFLKYMASSGWEADGVETDKGAKRVAEKKLGKKIEEKLDLVNEENKYDVISMWHVLEHVYNVEDYLKKINKLLKKGGVLVVGVPNCASYDAKKYRENWVAYDLPIHLSHFRKNNIKELAKKSSFTLKTIKPLGKIQNFFIIIDLNIYNLQINSCKTLDIFDKILIINDKSTIRF